MAYLPRQERPRPGIGWWILGGALVAAGGVAWLASRDESTGEARPVHIDPVTGKPVVPRYEQVIVGPPPAPGREP